MSIDVEMFLRSGLQTSKLLISSWLSRTYGSSLKTNGCMRLWPPRTRDGATVSIARFVRFLGSNKHADGLQ